MKVSVPSTPMCVSIVLSALIAADIAHAYYTMHTPDNPAQPQSAHRHQAAPLDVQGIVEAHLFGVPEPALADERHTPETLAKLLLEGTIATDSPTQGLAIISGDGPRRVYRVGASVGGAALHAVYFDHVLLSRNGGLESLFLPRPRRQNPSDVEVAPMHIDSLGRRVDQAPGAVEKIMRVVSSMDKDDKMRGVIVYPLGTGASLRALGLSPGDRLLSVNGKELDDIQGSKEILNGINALDELPATIERQGQTLSVMLNFADASRESAASQ